MCQVISNSLSATRTYKTRALMWVSATDPTLPQLGTLTVLRGRTPTTYLVGFDDADPRAVLLAKQDGHADVYAVRLTPAGQACGCTCPGVPVHRALRPPGRGRHPHRGGGRPRPRGARAGRPPVLGGVPLRRSLSGADEAK